MLKTNLRNYLPSCSLGQSDPAVETEMGLILFRNPSVWELNSITPSTPIVSALNVVDRTNSCWQKNMSYVLYMWSGWYGNSSHLFSIEHLISSLIDLHKWPVRKWVATTNSSWVYFGNEAAHNWECSYCFKLANQLGHLIQLKWAYGYALTATFCLI